MPIQPFPIKQLFYQINSQFLFDCLIVTLTLWINAGNSPVYAHAFSHIFKLRKLVRKAMGQKYNS